MTTSTIERLRTILETPRPPGPRGLPLFGPIVRYQRDPFAFLTDTHEEYGDVAFTRFAGMDAYLLSHPDAIEHVLVKNRKNYPKSAMSQRLMPLIGRGLLTSDGDLWTEQRKLIAPAFHHRRIQTYAAQMVECSNRRVEEWRSGAVRRVDADMMDLTLDIAVQTLFGAEARNEAAKVGAAFTEASEYFATTLAQPFPMPLCVPTPRNRAFLEARDTMHAVVRDIIRAKRATPADRRGDDLLSMLIEATDEDGNAMSDEQLRDEVLTLLLAGHETTALTLTYTFDLLSRHPGVREKLEAELDEVLGDRPPTAADLPRLVYTGRIIKESMRLYPPGAVLIRQARETDDVAGWRIPAGSMIAMAQWIVHRDPRWFSDPDRFIPERWTEPFEAALPRFAYFPFGGGPRICVGASFAAMEARLVLATIARRWRYDLLDHRPLELMMSVTIRPKRPVVARVTSRE